MALKLLALPLHPVILLCLVSFWGILCVNEKLRPAEFLKCLARVLLLVLLSLVGGFAALGLLLGFGRNPSTVLGLAPWAWALAGPTALVFGIGRARTHVATVGGAKERSDGYYGLFVSAALLATVVISLRYVISDDDGALSLPYRLFEWGIVDELGPTTDECLAHRVLEYGRDDDIGRDAIRTLARRGPSTAVGIRAKLADLREHWPPPAYTVKKSGIDLLLAGLVRFGDAYTARDWEVFDWRRKFPHPKSEERSVPLSH